MVLFASAAHFIVRTIKRTCQLFMYFTFLLAPSGGNKREHGVEAVKEKERCFPPPPNGLHSGSGSVSLGFTRATVGITQWLCL